DGRVVPGSETPAWIAVTDTRTGRALPKIGVDVALYEGAAARQTTHLTTDAAGLARTSFWIPPGVSGSPTLSLRARVPANGVSAAMDLGLREETPATPHLSARWTERQLKPDEVGHITIEAIDATNEPLAGQTIMWWIGPKGTSPPSTYDEWK